MDSIVPTGTDEQHHALERAVESVLDFMDHHIDRESNRVYDWPQDERDLHRSTGHLSFTDRSSAVSELRAKKIVSVVIAALRDEPLPECKTCDGSTQDRCLAFGCRERQDDRHTEWWCDYGCCTKAHVVDYYGEEAID